MSGRRLRPGYVRPLSPWARWCLVALLAGFGAAGTIAFVRDARQTDWSVAGAVWAVYVCVALAAGTVLALVLERRVRDGAFRAVLFGRHLAPYLAFAFFVTPITAVLGLQTAEVVQCHRTEGQTVQAHYERTGWARNLGDRTYWAGEYTLDGQTYEVHVYDEDEVRLRQVEPSDPDGALTDRSVVRSYDVPWVGSSLACARGDTSDFWPGLSYVVGGPLLALGTGIALVAVSRRVRGTDDGTDDSAPVAGSHPA